MAYIFKLLCTSIIIVDSLIVTALFQLSTPVTLTWRFLNILFNVRIAYGFLLVVGLVGVVRG